MSNDIGRLVLVSPGHYHDYNSGPAPDYKCLAIPDLSSEEAFLNSFDSHLLLSAYHSKPIRRFRVITVRSDNGSVSGYRVICYYGCYYDCSSDLLNEYFKNVVVLSLISKGVIQYF